MILNSWRARLKLGKKASAAETLLNQAIAAVGLPSSAASGEIFRNEDKIRIELAKINKKKKINVRTTGTIVEKICEHGLISSIPDSYYRLSDKEGWLGDFTLLAYPCSIIVSVKSFKAKERLLTSGTGSPIVPTIGFGWFDDPSEFSQDRCHAFKLRGFSAIYMPTQTHAAVIAKGNASVNANGNPLIRPISQMQSDLLKALSSKKFGTNQLGLISVRRI